MSDNIRCIIRNVREKLQDELNAIFIGTIKEGNPNPLPNEKVKDCIDFLKESNGASFGQIDLFPLNELDRNQFYVETLQGKKEHWICIGLVLYEPIVLNKINGQVYRFYRDIETEIPEECFGEFNNFLTNYVFGKKYAEIIPSAEDEEWYQFLKKVNLI